VSTWKVDDAGQLIPIEQWRTQQAQNARSAEITKYIEPDPLHDLWMPPSQNEIMNNGPATPDDYRHSAAGTEYQKTAQLGQTLRHQMDHNQQYRMRKLELDHQYRMEKTA